jgi:hypothetical protein
MAKSMGAEVIEDMLVFAMHEGHYVAAIGATEVLGDFGDPGLLSSTGGQPRPLADALRHPNRRLRVAAADAIMRIDPTQPYAGSSHLPETLGFLAATSGLRRALIGHPQPAEAQTLVGMLNNMGFDADTGFTSRQTFLKAVNSPDFEFLLISDGLDRPQVTALLQMLRTDRRTAALPVGILARVERLDTLKDQMMLDPLTEVFPLPYDDESMNFQARRLLALAGRHLVPENERLMHAAMALDHLATLATDREKYSMYNVLRQEEAVASALFVPELSSRAARVLGLIGSPSAQQTLVDFASRPTLPLDLRQPAVAAFDTAARLRGVLLTTDAIELQYRRYNETETAGPAVQQLLGAILDTIETTHQRAESPAPAADAPPPAAAAQPG